MMLEQYDQVVADLKRREEANKPLSAEKQKALTAGNAPSFGSKKAKVTLVEFSDFECPYCSKAAAGAGRGATRGSRDLPKGPWNYPRPNQTSK